MFPARSSRRRGEKVRVKSGRLYAAIGASRSGKSQFVMADAKRADRLLVWDVKGDPAEYGAMGCHRARNKPQLIALIKRMAGKPGKIAFTSDNMADFDYFCRCAQAWVRSHYEAGKNCVLVVEETADVTSPGKAPESYGVILRRKLAEGVTIYAITQRPAESDKTAVGNASVVRVCRLQLARDRKAAAADTGLPLEEINALRADQEKGEFDYITVDTGRGVWSRGRLTFPNGKPKFADEKAVFPL